MSARRAMVFTTSVATVRLLSTIGSAPPRYIWNASNSVPIGLYRLQPMTRLVVTELVAIQPPDVLAAFLDRNGYLPMRVSAIFQPARAGFQMRSGTRQSMPSISIASCAGDNVMEPSYPVIRGHTNPPDRAAW